MKLGFLTAPFEDKSLAEVATWAANNDFSALEVACWPKVGGAKRRYAGTSHINADGLTRSEGTEVVSSLAEKGIEISGLGYYPNPLHADPAHRASVIAHLMDLITAASILDVKIVNTFVGGDRTLTVDENWENARKILSPIVEHAKASGIKLCFENCPMIFSRDEWPGGHNIAYSPRIWRRIFDEWGDAVGMNFDPSHLIWLMIDQSQFINEFGPQMAHVHAKDLMIDRDGLYQHGVMSAGIGWQVPRLCGLGEVDWPAFFSGLNNAGYDGPIIIEHEDKSYEGSDEKIQQGFQIARDFLQPYIK